MASEAGGDLNTAVNQKSEIDQRVKLAFKIQSFAPRVKIAPNPLKKEGRNHQNLTLCTGNSLRQNEDSEMNYDVVESLGLKSADTQNESRTLKIGKKLPLLKETAKELMPIPYESQCLQEGVNKRVNCIVEAMMSTIPDKFERFNQESQPSSSKEPRRVKEGTGENKQMNRLENEVRTVKVANTLGISYSSSSSSRSTFSSRSSSSDYSSSSSYSSSSYSSSYQSTSSSRTSSSDSSSDSRHSRDNRRRRGRKSSSASSRTSYDSSSDSSHSSDNRRRRGRKSSNASSRTSYDSSSDSSHSSDNRRRRRRKSSRASSRTSSSDSSVNRRRREQKSSRASSTCDSSSDSTSSFRQKTRKRSCQNVKPTKRFRPMKNKEVRRYKDFAEFVILRPDTRQKMVGLEVLDASARFCNVELLYDQGLCTDGKFLCSIRLAGKRIACVFDTCPYNARKIAADEALDKLKSVCCSILIRDLKSTGQAVTPEQLCNDELLRGLVSEKDFEIPIMGWSNLSTGGQNEVGLEDDALQRIAIYLQSFRGAEDLIVLPELSANVKTIIFQKARQNKCLVSEFRSSTRRYTILSRLHTVSKLIASIRVDGGETMHCTLLEPTGDWQGDEAQLPFVPLRNDWQGDEAQLPFVPLRNDLMSSVDEWFRKDKILLRRSVLKHRKIDGRTLDCSGDRLRFVIVRMQSCSGFVHSPLVVLENSSDFCDCPIAYRSFSHVDGFRCGVSLDGVMVGQAVGSNEFEAKMSAAYESLCYLSTFCPTIVIMDPVKQVLESNENVIKPPQLKPRYARESSSFSKRRFETFMEDLFSGYLKAPLIDDLIFSPDLTASERAFVNNRANQRGLEAYRCAYTFGSRGKCFVVARHRDPFEIVSHVRANNGRTLRYRLFEPISQDIHHHQLGS